MPNAANAAAGGAAAAGGRARRGRGRPTGTASCAVLAVQGPRVGEVLVGPGARAPRRPGLHGVRRRRAGPGLPHRLHRRARLRAARAGRGRRPRCGTRCSPRPSRWAAARPGSAPGTPCAPRWATRCTARTSRLDITPVQAGSGWAVGWDKPEFWGRDALVAEKAAGPARRLRGLRAIGRGVPRPGMTVLRGRRAGRRDHLGHVLPDAAHRHRAGADRHVGRVSGSDDQVAVDVRGRGAGVRGRQAAVRAVARALTSGSWPSGRCPDALPSFA